MISSNSRISFVIIENDNANYNQCLWLFCCVDIKCKCSIQGHDKKDFELRFGIHDVSGNEFEHKSGIKRIKKSPDYDKTTLNHDIALVELEKPVDLNKNVYPADLPCGR